VRDALIRKARESASLAMSFIDRHAGAIEACALSLATRFDAGGRLYAMGNGGSACDALHLAVEFQHPILERRRALPAMSLVADPALVTAIGNDTDFARVFTDQLALVARPEDVVLGISTSGASSNVNRALKHAQAIGCLTIGFAGRDGGAMVDACDPCFVVPSWSPHRVQEVHTMLLHLLWDATLIAMGADDVL
jgi:D-sedoheptulose 7-phosphate isomerase